MVISVSPAKFRRRHPHIPNEQPKHYAGSLMPTGNEINDLVAHIAGNQAGHRKGRFTHMRRRKLNLIDILAMPYSHDLDRLLFFLNLIYYAKATDPYAPIIF
jgi:hypothetical protein